MDVAVKEFCLVLNKPGHGFQNRSKECLTSQAFLRNTENGMGSSVNR